MKNKEDIKKYQFFLPKSEGRIELKNYLRKFQYDVIEGAIDKNNDSLNFYYYENIGCFRIETYVSNDKPVIFWNEEIEEIFEKILEKEPEQDTFDTTSDEKIKKIKNRFKLNTFYTVFAENCFSMPNDFKPHILNEINRHCSLGLVYNTEIAKEKKFFKMYIENKLENIADELNKGQKIDWKDSEQVKYCISYDFKADSLGCYDYREVKHIGQIYCLDRNFLEVAKQEIGEDNLIKYFTGLYEDKLKIKGE